MHIQRYIKTIFFVFFFGIIFLYCAFALRNALRGPAIIITPLQSPTTADTVVITGSASRVEELTINSIKTPLSTEGSFEHTVVLIEGYNTFIIEGHDRFGTKTRTAVHLWKNEVSSSEVSTPSMTDDGPEAAVRQDESTPIQ
jgi:hypothetical protein